MQKLTVCIVVFLSLCLVLAGCRGGESDEDGGDKLDSGVLKSVPDAGKKDTGQEVNDICDPVNPSDLGDCGTALGVSFDGDLCNYVRGCDCEPHCHQMFNSIAECESTCLGYVSCGMGQACDEGMYCAFADGDSCGDNGETALCKPNPMICASSASPVCGCDGQTYDNECKANQAGTGIRSTGACS